MALWLASIEHGQVLVLGASDPLPVCAQVQSAHRATMPPHSPEAELDALHGELNDIVQGLAKDIGQ